MCSVKSLLGRKCNLQQGEQRNNFIIKHKIIIFQSSYKIIKKVQKESGRGFRKMDILKMSNFEKGPINFFGKI
jgi:hypothetical protein